jgi:anhydro-N-acetylmuramic acid kinase
MHIASLDQPAQRLRSARNQESADATSSADHDSTLSSEQRPVLAGYPAHEFRQVLGMISGTSADGVDVARVQFPPCDSEQKLQVLDFQTVPYPGDLKKLVLDAAADKLSLRQTARLDRKLSEFFASVAQQAVGTESVALVASHGQTVAHLPECHTTVQLGDGSLIANRTGIVTVSDFRTADMALGGQGAPLVPLFDAYLLASPSCTRIAVNLGGIANITVVSAGDGPVTAWDTGPANCVSDALCRLCDRGEFDPGGEAASRGQVDDELLQSLLQMEYFLRIPPKSTGLEDFGEVFARKFGDSMKIEDRLRTALALSAQTLVDAVVAHLPAAGSVELIFAGGGTANETLMDEIRSRLRSSATRSGLDTPVCRSFKDFGVDEECREAVAFAFLGDRTARGLVGSVPSTTGANRAAILGKVSFPSPS